MPETGAVAAAGRGYSRTAAAAEPGGWEPNGAPGQKGAAFRVRRLDVGFEVTTSDGEVFRAGRTAAWSTS